MNINRYFIIACLITLILILIFSHCELKKSKNHAVAVIDIDDIKQRPYIDLSPIEFDLTHNIYIYMKDSKPEIVRNISKLDKYKYKVENVKQHISEVLTQPVRSICNNIKNAIISRTPLQCLFGASVDIANVVGLTSILSPDESITIEHHIDDNVSAFIANNYLYIIRNKVYSDKPTKRSREETDTKTTD